MRRIYPDYVYGDGPRQGCWWDETCDLPDVPEIVEDLVCDIAVIGAGFTGLNAALVLAKAGKSVAVFDAKAPGWGASGRNGGFCCLGGSKLDDVALDRAFGKPARLEWRRTEMAAVDHVTEFLRVTGTDADQHSQGETWLAHRPKDMQDVEDEVASHIENYGVAPEVHSAADLDASGMSAGFFGGLTSPLGFALNPRKYLAGLLRACLDAGVQVYRNAPARRLRSGWRLDVAGHDVTCKNVLIATNGYSSEDLPDWLAGRYMPTQSSVVVTRPMSDNELGAQGWTSRQMSYDSRNMLHYFRLMPDNRMLFGMRGGLGASARSEARSLGRVLQNFCTMFPAWAHVDLTNYWSGMVCLSRDFTPFVGEIPDAPGLWAAMCYHGNGVAMGSYSGAMVGHAMLGQDDQRPEIVRAPSGRFPLGRMRRALMVPAYAGFILADM